jgi:hypothetical protein
MMEKNPRPFSSKVRSKSQYNIWVKPISFAQKGIIYFKDSWIVTIGGPL